jgi:alkanesulfonate monooxygenase SsuD/methylene tetrahydromethanopterin reductase-like flavin-dependent oxidoreductase (luciferase family)
VLINHVVFCRDDQRQDEIDRIRHNIGLPPGSLDECPYVLIGEPERLVDQLREWQARLRLEALLLVSSIARDAADRLMSEVIARV